MNDTDANTNRANTMEESLSSYFQRSAAIVRQYSDLIEQEYAQPVLRYASLQFKKKPVTMTFLSIFAGFSVLPVLSFIGLTIFTFSFIAFVALVIAAILFIGIEAVLVVCLFFTLWSLLVAASFTTAIVLFAYWVTRLGVLVSYEGRSGITDWAHETRNHFYPKKREATEESDESAVLVDQDGPSAKKIKSEE